MKIVLLPGLDGTGILFQPLLEHLPPDVDAMVIAYPPEKLNYEELVNFVMGQLPGEDYILVGESFSGNIAYQIAKKEPEHLRSVIFVATFLSSPRPVLLKIFNVLPGKLLLSIKPPKFLIKHFLLGESVPQSTINLFLKVIAKIPPDVLAFRLREIGKLQYDGSKCNVNAIYIQATDDCLVTKNAENDFKTCFDGLQIKRVDGPHFILQANPAVCSKIIEEETSLRMITNPHQ